VATRGPSNLATATVSLNRSYRRKSPETLLCVCGVLLVDTHPVTTTDPLDEELSHRRTAAGENRIPPAAAVVVAAVVYALLPQSLLLGPRFATRGTRRDEPAPHGAAKPVVTDRRHGVGRTRHRCQPGRTRHADRALHDRGCSWGLNPPVSRSDLAM
jgi:hypothetical protein